MKLCISEATTMPATFAEDVAAFAAAGWPAMEVWLTKLETHLQTHSVAQTRDLLVEKKLTLAAASFQGGLLLSQGEARKAHFDHFRRRLAICQEFGVPTLVVVGDFRQHVDVSALQRSIVSLKQAAQWADGFGVRLALEFHGGDDFCSCLDTAIALVEQCGEPNVGICLDLFHYYKGPSKPEDLERLTHSNLVLVQASDVADVPRELMTDADRIMPGDGDFRIESFIKVLKSIDYAGYISLELFNPVLWQVKPTQVAELSLAALRRFVSD
jgi:sugar phosphate isomerase/epimerase